MTTQLETATIAGVRRADLPVRSDARGDFVECFRAGWASDVPAFSVAQVNVSVSAQHVIRGVHYFAGDQGQVKYVTCVHGEVLDVAVDLRVDSPTFGLAVSTPMSQAQPCAVLLPRGVGHAFMALSDRAVVAYLCDREYVPGLEHTVHPLDADLALPWPAGVTPVLSERDEQAPSLREARDRGLLARS